MSGSLRIALLGFGTVGRAFADFTSRSSGQHPFEQKIRAIADSSGGLFIDTDAELHALLAYKASGRSVRDFAPQSAIVGSAAFIQSLSSGGVESLVESLPTNLTDGQPGLDLNLAALSRGISVVTVDKGPLVHGYDRLTNAAASSGARLAYSGTTGVRPPGEVQRGRVVEMRGILNGTTNYILSEMQERSITFEQALMSAQEQGIAEPDPSLDTGGWDTACKILILAREFMGADAALSDVSRVGIGPETDSLLESARARGSAVRLIGRARIWQGRVRVSVAPKIVKPDSPFYGVSGTRKAAIFRTEGGEFFAMGRSGRDAISQTITEDIARIAR